MNQLAKKKSKTDTVTLSRADYRRLIERLEEVEDDRDAHAVLAGIRNGSIAVYPAEVVHRLVDGESPIKVFRDYRGLSAAALAERVGIARPYLTQIENGTRQAMFGVMQRIAEALDVSLDQLGSRRNTKPTRRTRR